jgi:hypothetical protein
MKGILIFGALLALVAVASWFLYPKERRTPAHVFNNHSQKAGEN